MSYLTAYDGDKVIGIELAEKGKKYKCKICLDDVVRVYPKDKIKHFRHVSSEDEENTFNCPLSRKIDMTPWHRNWCLKFKPEYREVFIKNPEEGEPNCRADVKTDFWTIEFQHSNIDIEDIERRNRLSGRKILWILDGKSPHITNLRKLELEFINVFIDTGEKFENCDNKYSYEMFFNDFNLDKYLVEPYKRPDCFEMLEEMIDRESGLDEIIKQKNSEIKSLKIKIYNLEDSLKKCAETNFRKCVDCKEPNIPKNLESWRIRCESCYRLFKNRNS